MEAEVLPDISGILLIQELELELEVELAGSDLIYTTDPSSL